MRLYRVVYLMKYDPLAKQDDVLDETNSWTWYHFALLVLQIYAGALHNMHLPSWMFCHQAHRWNPECDVMVVWMYKHFTSVHSDIGCVLCFFFYVICHAWFINLSQQLDWNLARPSCKPSISRTHYPVSFLFVVKLPLKAPEKDEEDEQEATVSLAASEEICLCCDRGRFFF